jgi:hypothetical protein
MLAIFFGIVIPKRRRARARQQPVSLIPFVIGADVLPSRPVRLHPIDQSETPAVASRSVEEAVAPPMPNMRMEAAVTPMPVRADYPPLRLEVGGSGEGGVSVPEFRKPLRVEPSAHDGTLQFLPGRLEILEGREAGQEIRFVRTPGPDGTVVSFGRAEGPPYRHVQLSEATVSRHHARMAHDGKAWRLVNLSRTNPVVINGRPMVGEGDAAILNDGDRVEMGEIVFRFHAR